MRVFQHINSDFNFSFAVEEFFSHDLPPYRLKIYRHNYLLIKFRNSF